MEWVLCKNRLPKSDLRFGAPQKDYLCVIQHADVDGHHYMVLNYCDGWNCSVSMDGTICKDYELKGVVAWCEVPRFEEER